MHYEGPRRQGRFIKQGSKVSEKISLMEFSFQEVSEAKVVSHDNAKRSIIHSHYHAEEELDETLTQPDKFNDDLVPGDQKRPVLLPLDFTKEWERDKKMRKDRVLRGGDDEFELELEAQRAAEQVRDRAAAQAPAAPAPASAPASAGTPTAATGAPVAQSPIPAPAPTRQAPAAAPITKAASTVTTGSEKQWEYMDQVGQAIKSMQPPTDGTAPPTAAASPAPAAAPRKGDQFIPAATGTPPVPSQDSAHDPESAAAREYRQRVQEQQITQKQLDTMVEEAKAKGYRDGFRTGEEKAEVQVRQSAGQVFGKVQELLQELGNLKHAVLDNVQQNFYELCQAMAESLIKREFSLHPETFVTVMRRAINEAVEPGKFRIRVHPEFYEKLAALGDAELKDALVRDAEIPPGDFKIESNLSVVDVSIGKMIAELLQKADLNLFDAEDKAS